MATLPSIYLYLDYRQYLADVLEELKKETSSASYRSFARMAGSSSPNFLQLLRARKISISDSQRSSLAQSLALSTKEGQYFEIICAFDHAKTHKEKDICFQQIMLTREYKQVANIENRQYEFFSNWYNPVIRELVLSTEYPGNPDWVVERIVPEISSVKVRKSIELIESLNLITRNEAGLYVAVDRTISTPSEVLSVAIVKYHQSVIELGSEAIERFTAEERDIRSVTIGLTEDGYIVLKQKMEAVWKELLAYADTQQCDGTVAQVNMQLFPLTRKGKVRK